MNKLERYTDMVYISGPYSGPLHTIVENISFAAEYAMKYIKAGIAIHCPHKSNGGFCGLVPYMEFIRMDLKIIDRCDAIVMIPGWKKSRGARIEFLHAWRTGKEIIYEV